MKKTIVLLSGAKRSGKDTVGQMIFEQLLSENNFHPIKTSFAAKLKEASATLTNIIYNTDCFKVEQFSDESVRQGDYPFIQGDWAGKQICLRTVLQHFGTEVCRKSIDYDIWVNTVVKFIETNINDNVFIITDARFPNEINIITKTFKSTCNVLSVLIKRQELQSTDTHESESFFQQMEQDGLYTSIIENNSSLDSLKQKVKRFVGKNIIKSNISKDFFESEKGIRDFYPQDQHIQTWLFSKFREASKRHGFSEYSPAILEPEIMYRIKSGDEIISQMYSFETKEHNKIALRPEVTPSLVRMIAKKGISNLGPLPLRWFTIGQCFRFETVSSGRSREHYQWNADIVGNNSETAEIELIMLLIDFFKSIGLSEKEIVIKISSRELMDKILLLLNVSNAQKQLIYSLFDRVRKISTTEFLNELDIITTDESLKTNLIQLVVPNFKLTTVTEMFASIDKVELPDCMSRLQLLTDNTCISSWLELDLSIVRGLGYYTGVVFEAFSRDNSICRSICGGGRYDNLMDTLSGTLCSMIGFGFGDCVIKEVLSHYSIPTGDVVKQSIMYVIIPFSHNEMSMAYNLASQLRENNKTCSVIISKVYGALWKAFEYANKIGAQYAILLAPDELKMGKVRIKKMSANNIKEYNVDINTFRSAFSPESFPTWGNN